MSHIMQSLVLRQLARQRRTLCKLMACNYCQVRAWHRHQRALLATTLTSQRIRDNVCLPSPSSRMYVAPWPQHLSSHCLSQLASAAAVNDILHSATTRESLDKLQAVLSHSDRLISPEDTAKIVQHLMKEKYEELQAIPWMQSNIHLSYVQLVLSDRLGKETLDLWESGVGERLMEVIAVQASQFTNDDAVNTLMGVLYLGCDSTSPLLHSLLADCIRRTATLDMHQLAGMSYVSQCIHRNSAGMAQLIPRAKTLLQDPQHEWTPQVAESFIQVLINCRRVVSYDLWRKATARIAESVHDPAFLSTPAMIGTHLRFSRKLFYSQLLEFNQARLIIEKATEAALRLLPVMSTGHIAEICSSLKTCRCYTEDVAKPFQERSLELLQSSDCKLSDISNLLYALNANTHISVKRRFETALYENMDDIDSIVLSNIAENLLTVNIRNRDVLLRFQELIVDHTQTIFNYASRFTKVVRLLARRRFLSQRLENQFNQRLFTLLEQNKSVTLSEAYMSSLASYLLPRSRPTINDRFLSILLSSIPKWKIPSLYRLSFGLNSINRNHVSDQLRYQLSLLQTCLHTTILDKVDDIQTLDYLYQLTLGLVLHSRNRDPTLSEQIMSKYQMFTHNLTDVGMMKVTQMFCGLNYYLQSVYEDLCNFAIDNASSLDTEKVYVLLQACAKVGYIPSRQEEFVDMVLMFAEKMRVKGDLNHMLSMITNLAIIQAYPEKALAEIFNLDFMEKADEYMEAHPQTRRYLEKHMMTLNRSVLLECPQLDIPWFHEQYCMENVDLEEDQELGSLSRRFCDEVETALIEVLGDRTLLRRWSLTPYYYILNFECLLDEEQNPVELRDDINGSSSLQRVGVLILNENSFCYNSKRLVGTEQAKKRHLEIMGYKVVEVPYFDWYSMGLTDWQAKVDYLSSKILE